jgi:sulfur carrier protein ThiS
VVILVLSATGCNANPALQVVDDEREANMTLLHIALQEGFWGDTVIVRVNGEQVFREKDVKTRLQIGLADSVELDVAEGPTQVEVLLPSKNLSDSVQLDVSAPTYVGVSIVDGKITFRISDMPFGYL